jgi:hypothetical protein
MRLWHPSVNVASSNRAGRLRSILIPAVFLFVALPVFVQGQEPAPPPPPVSASPAPATAAPKPQTDNKKYSHANDFLIRGTVFNDKALSFPDVELRLRRTNEKKIRWQSFTNSRGEFAIRVPQGAEYEMVVHRKGFKDQTRIIDAQGGTSEESTVFRMELATGEKK